MEELMAALKATEDHLKSFEGELKETKHKVDGNNGNGENNKPKRRSSGMIDFNSAKKAVQKESPKISFSKGSRFKGSQQENDLDVSQSSVDTISTQESVSNIEAIRKRTPTVFFPKAKRFDEKHDITTEFNLDPNFESIKRKYPAAVIKNPSKKDPKVKLIQKLHAAPEQTWKAGGEIDAQDSIETVRLKAAETGVVDISDLISDTTEVVGPGKYNLNYSAVEPQKNVAFSRSIRFQPARAESEDTPINPNYDAVKKTIPAVKIMKETPANEKLIQKREGEERLRELSAQMRLATPLVKDAGILPHVPGVLIKDTWAKLTDKEKFFRIITLLKKRREIERVAPGTYNPKDLYEPVCMVKFRRSHSPRIVRVPDRIPSPTRYYAKDDLIYPTPYAFTFNKDGIEKKPKIEDLDLRAPLKVNYDQVLKRIPAAILLPEHTGKRGPELHEVKMGPGVYDIKHDLVERRPDIGVMKYPDITEKNARENIMDLANKDVFDAALEPNYDQVLPRAPAYKIHSPVKLEGPAHLPEKVLHPERWVHYDVNIDAVKPDVPEAVIAGGLTKEEYAKKEALFNMFLKERAKQIKKPEAGQYNVNYRAIEPEAIAVDFDRYPERGLEEEKREDVDVEGDVLLLNPQQPKPHLATVKFDTMKGREEPEKDVEYREELLLEPRYTLTQPKTVTLVDMNRQTDRKDMNAKKVDELQEELILNVKYDAVDPKIKGIPDFDKNLTREDLNPPKAETEELILNPSKKLTMTDTSHTITMDSKSQRFKELPKEDINDGRETTAQRIDINKAYDSIKPDKTGVDFKRYDSRDMEKENMKKKALALANKLAQEKQAKNKELAAIEEEKEGGFEKYGSERPEETKIKLPEKSKRLEKLGKKSTQPIKPEPLTNQLSPWEDNGNQGNDNEGLDEL